jgi:hypothetical protein
MCRDGELSAECRARLRAYDRAVSGVMLRVRDSVLAGVPVADLLGILERGQDELERQLRELTQ